MSKQNLTPEVREWFWRRQMARFCVKTLDEMPKGDPRREDALEHYKKELAEIDAKLTELTGTPPPVVVGLKTAKLIGESDMKE